MGTRTIGLTTKQGSLYNLTLDEVQHQLSDLGRPLSSMNIDDLINTVWTADQKNQSNQGINNNNNNNNNNNQSTRLADLRTKTVDEFWHDMKKNISDNIDRKTTCDKEKQPTLGEMTLEDFLAKAGIVAESSSQDNNKKKNSALGAESGGLFKQDIDQQLKKNSDLGAESVGLFKQDIDLELAQWIKYQIPPVQQQHVFVPGHHPAQQVVTGDVAYPETILSDAQIPRRKKRVASGDLMEKTVERRQKRIIKNRESAARSRARKQAYTHELENKVSRLEEENEILKREQEAEKALLCVALPEPRYQLRTTSSALF